MQFPIFLSFLWFTMLRSIHNGFFNPVSFTDQDPLLMLVNELHPTRPLTIYDTQNEEQIRLPVGLAELSLEALPFQAFHSYYESFGKNFYLEWNGRKKVKILPEGDYLQAKRNFTGINSGMTAHSINNGLFVKIMAEGKCMEVSKDKSRYRDAYPLVFKKCSNQPQQNFKFVAREKAICKLKECTSKEEIFRAEEIIRNRINHFLI